MLSAIGIITAGSKIKAPSIVGLTPSAANQKLQDLGIPYTYSGGTSSGATPENNGYVASQSIAADDVMERSAGMSYYTYSYTAPTCTPNYQITSGNCRTGYTYTDVSCGTGSYTTPGDSNTYITGIECTVVQYQSKWRYTYAYCDGTAASPGSWNIASCPSE